MAPLNFEEWETVLKKTDVIIGANGNVETMVRHSKKHQDIIKVWGSKGHATMTITNLILTNMEVKAGKCPRKKAFANRTSINHYHRLMHSPWWTVEPAGDQLFRSQCGCSAREFSQDYPAPTVTSLESSQIPASQTRPDELITFGVQEHEALLEAYAQKELDLENLRSKNLSQQQIIKTLNEEKEHGWFRNDTSQIQSLQSVIEAQDLQIGNLKKERAHHKATEADLNRIKIQLKSRDEEIKRWQQKGRQVQARLLELVGEVGLEARPISNTLKVDTGTHSSSKRNPKNGSTKRRPEMLHFLQPLSKKRRQN